MFLERASVIRCRAHLQKRNRRGNSLQKYQKMQTPGAVGELDCCHQYHGLSNPFFPRK